MSEQIKELVETAAQNIVARHKLDQDEGERGIEAWSWALGGPIDFETGLRELVVEVIELDRAQRDLYNPTTKPLPDISRQLDTIRDQIARIDELEQLNVIAHERQRELETDIVLLREQLELQEGDAADAREESSDVIRKCNEQLAAMAAAAKLRDQQVETLARLWSAAFEKTGSPVGAVITRQLYRLMADHGIDVSNMPDPLTADCA